MTYRIRVSPTALQEAESIYTWIAKEYPDNAAIWFNGLFEVIESLETMPFRCPLAPEAEVLGEEIRHFIYRRNYRILYKIVEDVVQIFHIRHAAQKVMGEEDF